MHDSIKVILTITAALSVAAAVVEAPSYFRGHFAKAKAGPDETLPEQKKLCVHIGQHQVCK